MTPAPTHWNEWAETLRRLHLDGFAAWMLEAGGPLNVIAAQFLYIGQPFLPTPTATQRLQDLAHLLENQDEAQTFIEFLRTPAP